MKYRHIIYLIAFALCSARVATHTTRAPLEQPIFMLIGIGQIGTGAVLLHAAYLFSRITHQQHLQAGVLRARLANSRSGDPWTPEHTELFWAENAAFAAAVATVMSACGGYVCIATGVQNLRGDQ